MYTSDINPSCRQIPVGARRNYLALQAKLLADKPNSLCSRNFRDVPLLRRPVLRRPLLNVNLTTGCKEMTGSPPQPTMVSKMETSNVAKLDTSVDLVSEPTTMRVKFCPKCGTRGSGPYRRRVGRGNYHAFYYKHTVTENGARRTIWHHISMRDSPLERREKLVRMVKARGWCGMRYFGSLLHVSARTDRKSV